MFTADTKYTMMKTLFYVCCIMLAYIWYMWDNYKRKNK